jgi:alpha-D-ribose 1-methylphosphonate 5-triphosphate synthase subunit PhnG
MDRNRRTELLAASQSQEVRQLAETFLNERVIAEELHVICPPEIGMVMMQVREPVCRERFHLGEVVVTRAEVAIAGFRGWAVRAGSDRETALAAALLDACAEYDSEMANQVTELCDLTAGRIATDERSEWQELLATAVAFEELD